MRAIIGQSISNMTITLKPAAVLVFLLMLFFMAALIVVRQQCVRQGYEISYLTISLDNKNLEYEQLSREYSATFRREVLMNKAEELGFVFPVGGKVFYVQR